MTRLDRDLLDVNTMIHILLRSLAPTDRHSLQELIQLSTSRVRRGLKTMAFYAKVSSAGVKLYSTHADVDCGSDD